MATAKQAIRAVVKNRGNRSMWRSIAGAGVQAERSRLVPSRYVWEQYPEAAHLVVPMGDVQFGSANMDPLEVYCLALLCLLRKPRRIFEFGTFDGATTLRLARLLPDVEIFTLDLPDADSEAGQSGQRSGYRFHGTPQERQVTQLYGDSRRFDFTAWYGTVDLVIVDAGHGYDCIHADTMSALSLVADRGVVVWDDYCSLWPDVVRAVDEAADAGLVRPVHLRGTEMAVWDQAVGS